MSSPDNDVYRDALDREIDALLTSEGGWGTWGSASEHKRYSVPLPPKSRRRCHCCGKRATHAGMANGVALMGGCEGSVDTWVTRA
jgi:hypothetical protein